MADGVSVKDLGDAFQMPSVVLNLTSTWLIKQQDKETGMFYETGVVHNRMYAVSKSRLFDT